jgi:PTH1 family peptidyl-tRNA hydrolase
VADTLVDQWKLPKFRRSGRSLATEGRWAGETVVILKPQTFMNRSGEALHPLRSSAGFEVSRDLLVLVDDFALSLGTFRLRALGSAGGHNGLRSVEAALGTNTYARLRIGIGPVPADVDDPADFVLAPLARHERAVLIDLLPGLADAVECWLDEGIEEAMNRFNRRGTTE